MEDISIHLSGQLERSGADGQVNLECVESSMSLERLLNQTVELTAEEIVKYVRVIGSDKELDERLNRDFE